MSQDASSTKARFIPVPLVKIDGKTSLLLKDISPAFHFRAVHIDAPVQVKDPSDHRLLQARAEGSVKCTSTRAWDISEFVSKKPPPGGA